MITGLEGGLIWGGDPLPVVEEPTDIFTNRQLRTPLKITTKDIEDAVRDIAFENPTFSELSRYLPMSATTARSWKAWSTATYNTTICRRRSSPSKTDSARSFRAR